MTKKVILAMFVLAVVGLALFGSERISAQSSSTTNPNIIQKITERFGLKQSDVQTVFDEYHKERFEQMRTERRTRLEEKLSEEVSSRKITEVQKQAILNKFDELQNKREAERTELEAWAKTNDINLGNLHMGMRGFKFGHGMHL